MVNYFDYFISFCQRVSDMKESEIENFIKRLVEHDPGCCNKVILKLSFASYVFPLTHPEGLYDGEKTGV